MFLCGCTLFEESNRRQQLRETLARGQQQLLRGDYEGSLKAFESVIAVAQNQAPADLATYNMALVYAHRQNPKKDLRQAIGAFNQVIDRYPESVWAGQARVWVGVLNEAEESKKEIARTKLLVEQSQEEIERNRQAAEKSKQENEKSRLDLDRLRQEIEKMKLMLEKSKQIDIDIEKKRRERAK